MTSLHMSSFCRQNLGLLFIAIALPFTTDAGTIPPASRPEKITNRLQSPVTATSLVRVNSTNQNYHLMRPWAKRSPYNRRGTGVVIDGSRILVTAELVTNSNFIELENPETQERSPATIALADYEANLAILIPTDPDFLKNASPVHLAKNMLVGERVEVTQMEPTGSLARTPGTITTIALGNYPTDGTSLLIYRVSVPLQYRDNSFNLPVFAGADLAGILMRYDARTQTADLVPSPVIQSFLTRAESSTYQSFPRLGVGLASNRDPKFRRFLGMTAEQSGVYVASIAPGSPAANAGLKKGDVILAIDDLELDDDGNFLHRLYGKTSFAHYIATEKYPGDEISIKLLRDGAITQVQATLAPRDLSKMISAPFFVNQAPRYFIMGGIVMQELSRAVLKEWGGDWQKNAPQRLVFLDEFQDELPDDRGKVIFISQILPSDATLGYEDFATAVIESINDRPIRSLEDVAEAAKHPIEGFHRIRIDIDPRIIILDAKEVEEGAPVLQQTYDLPGFQNL